MHVLYEVLAMISIMEWKTIVPNTPSRVPGRRTLTNQVRIDPQKKNNNRTEWQVEIATISINSDSGE